MDLLPSPSTAESGPCSQDLGDGTISRRKLDSNIFRDTYFLTAAHTFQDHLFNGWFTKSHRCKLEAYHEGIQTGTLALPWKDEVWERENPRPTKPARICKPATATAFAKNANAG